MQNKKKKTVCIIGAGIAGLSAAALFAKKGYQVIVFEKSGVLGGRALSLDANSLTLKSYQNILSSYHSFLAFSDPDIKTIFEKKLLSGYTIDLGYHAIGGGVFSNLNQLLGDFDEHLDFLESYVGLIHQNSYDFPFLSKLDKVTILPNILRLLFASEKTLLKLDTVSITETIERYGKGNMKLILEVFSRSITTVNNLDRISTGEMFRAQRNLYRGSKPVGYPKGGMGVIHHKLSRIIEDYQGIIKLNTPVKKILFENGKAVGVQTEQKNYSSNLIVYAGLLQSLFEVADKKQFPNDYVNTINSLTGTGSLSGYYSLKTIPDDLIGKTFHFIERNVGVDGNDVVGMIDFMAADLTARISPKDASLVQSYIICTPEEAKDKAVLHRLRQILDKHLGMLIPDFKEQLNWALYPSVYHLDGVAKTIDNAKPSIETPIENLFVIGDGVKAYGIGFNCALNSARLLAKNF